MSEKEYIYVEVNQIDQDRQETKGEVHCELGTLLNIIDMLKYIILQTNLELKAMEVSESRKGIDQLIDEALRRIDE